VVEGAHGIGAELGAVSRGRRGIRVEVCGGSAMASKAGFRAVKRGGGGRTGGAPRWCAPLIGARGDGMKAVQRQSRGRQNGSGSHGLDVVCTVWALTFGQ
jgi:hypothetical protein